MAELTPTEERMARGLGITPEQYEARKAAQAALRAKPSKAERIVALKALLNSSPRREREALEARIRLLEEDGQ